MMNTPEFAYIFPWLQSGPKDAAPWMGTSGDVLQQVKDTYSNAIIVCSFMIFMRYEHNYGVVNPAEQVLVQWLNETVWRRTRVRLRPAEMDVLWSVVVSSLSVGSIFGALLNR
jgi:hypothetical protein